MLNDVRVVDLTRALAGPSCTRLLADLGAEVIKIEPPGGDFTREFPQLRDGISGYFLQRNYGKKSVCVNLMEEEGRQIVYDLVGMSDVVVENYRPGVMQRLGLEFEKLSQINPRVIVCSISGYGQYGPYSDRAAGDHAIQAMSGLMWMTGEEDGPPMWGGSAYTDVGAGLHAFGAICAALLRRHSTGEGERIDVSLFDCAFWQHEFAVEQFLNSDGMVKPQRMGNRRVGTAPSGIYQAVDGYIALVVFSDSGWEKLAEAIGRPELAEDPRFNNRQSRWDNADDVDEVVEQWLMKQGSVDEAVVTLADRFGLPCAKVMTVEESIRSPQVRERGLLTEINDQVLGKVAVQGMPVKFSHGTVAPTTSAPLLGEHTRPVLQGLLGLSDERIFELLGAGVLQVDDRVLQNLVGDG